jgi:hypothetical protein
MAAYITCTENKNANTDKYLKGEYDGWNELLGQTCVILCDSCGPGETVLYVPVEPVARLQLQFPGTTTVPLTSVTFLRLSLCCLLSTTG